MNPGSTGEVDWVRGDSETCNSDPSCQELADGSPYPADDVPDYPHSNCLCFLVPRLRDSQDFRDDVKAWVNGEDVGYMDDWYDNYYSQSA